MACKISFGPLLSFPCHQWSGFPHQQPLGSSKIRFSTFLSLCGGLNGGIGLKGPAQSCFLSLSLPFRFFFLHVNRSSLGLQYWIGGCCVYCTLPEAAGCLANTLPHIPALLPLTDNWHVDCNHMIVPIWVNVCMSSCMERETHSTPEAELFTDTKSSQLLSLHAFSNRWRMSNHEAKQSRNDCLPFFIVPV